MKLTQQSSSADFWNSEGHEELLKELSQVNSRLEGWKFIRSEYEDLITLETLLQEDDDHELEAEFFRRASDLRSRLERESLLLLLNEPYDNASAILMIHAGSGGLDSQDWAGMLMRMYLRYCERSGLKAKVIEATADEGEGIKS
ncbi:MAG: PCRF domain-containing protein, partial [Synergistaceae bacterium]|nr:PCRF domain-containing protein [Synergistaceae bacterium]